ncbi:MAG: peptidyl-prolyl cis-trans isomerase [Chloroflexi bacterium AL-W]|nr:peptidyl-prolyl cis-trans isomerase [Chloroflexi bacterium AL-N1]NOK68206.1 peptidyl-prolyl cis-trans isomerase [Chloroflexi bacterium AL-N10]NOK73852.1 peptidyl-prolyl cis-trans isomerase [Chloroflexi bacterium AL-N5]NOK82820.1 peptidyl-prolyl cis-trans isomerase [Chloroflexi bacterium AL-W]NOK90342.1 peptidyl-prolyl cis-trans isomerase [Chloroflexi bacterium AL-N15]
MHLRQWTASLVIVLLIAACGSPAGTAVARFDNVTLTQTELDQRIALIKAGFEEQAAEGAQGAPPLPDDQQIEQQLVELFIQQNLTLKIARDRGVEVADEEVDEQIELFRSGIEQSGATLDDAVTGQLGFDGAESTEFRQFVSSLVAQEKIGETLVTSETVQAEVTEQVQQEASEEVDEVQAAHILVETEEEAADVLQRLEDGEEFEAVAREVSVDPSAAENGGDLGYAGRGQFVPEFEAAIFEELEPDETTAEPIQTQFGFHIITVLDRRTGPAIPEEEVPFVIEQRVQQEIGFRRQQAVQELLEEERITAEEEGLLEVPEYPTETPFEIDPGEVAPGDPNAEPEAPAEEGGGEVDPEAPPEEEGEETAP